MPIESNDESAPSAKPQFGETPASPQGEKRRILLAEDNDTNMMVTNDFLEAHGYQVITAVNGVDAIKAAQSYKPDLILMDIQMPGMNGLEAIKRLRKISGFESVPIIALTALAMPNDRERCIEAGMDEYISKPVNLRGLVKLIQNYLSLREEKTQPR